MKIEHIALWVRDLETMKIFYCTSFGAAASEKYINELKMFSSYFLTFKDGARLELMHMPELELVSGGVSYGWAHLAISTGSKEEVDRLTDMLRKNGCTITGDPRITGDGYYEGVVLDPEGNQLEITV